MPEASSGYWTATLGLGEHPGHKGGRFLCSGPAPITPSSGEGDARGLEWVLVPQLAFSFSVSTVSSDLRQG